MQCVNLENCPFYNDNMPMQKGIGSIFKKKYCEGSSEFCARYMVLSELGPDYVTSSLYPNMTDIAAKLIQDVKDGK